MARIHESHGRQLALCMLYGASDSCPFHLYSFDTWTQIFDLHEEIIAGIIDHLLAGSDLAANNFWPAFFRWLCSDVITPAFIERIGSGTIQKALVGIEGPVCTRLEFIFNLAILIAINAIGDDHISFIQARNLAGPPVIPEKMMCRPDMGG